MQRRILCTLVCPFFFVPTKMQRRILCTLVYSFFFVPTKKNESRKRRPPKTAVALLRLAMTARQIRFAQTPLFSAIAKLRIRSSTGRHVRNGRFANKHQQLRVILCWKNIQILFTLVIHDIKGASVCNINVHLLQTSNKKLKTLKST